MFKFSQKLLAGLIISISFFSLNVKAFEDVTHSDPYFYAVEHLRRHKIIVDGKFFHPELEVSKAEFVKYLVKINNPDFKEIREAKLPFSDTRNNAWYASYFEEAIKLGILDSAEDKVYPYKKLNLPEALELLFHSKSIPVPHKHIGPIDFEDVKNNKRYAPIIMRAFELGLIKPEKEKYFGIYRKINRAKAADLIFQLEMLNVATYETQEIKRNQAAENNPYSFELQKVISAWELIRSGYVDRDNIDETKMSDKAINAILETLDDPYSVYLDKTANQNFTDEIEGKFEGIGAYISLEKENEITIVSPIKGSPADAAGVKPGDIIRKVDGWETAGHTLQEVVTRIKGPRGTDVVITVERGGGMLDITVTRDVINVSAVEHDIIENGKIMYAKLITFNQNAAANMREITQIAANNKEIKGFILDLRGNPGGLLDSAIDIISLFAPKNSPAVTIQYNYFNVTQETTKDGILKGIPMVILIDKGSASASEIVAGTLKELEIATIVGETSFGKGTVQEVNYFEDASSIKMTVAKWLTPKGSSIQGNGIQPDIEVKMTEENRDRQLEKAIAEINKKIK